MNAVSKILELKGSTVHTIHPEETVLDGLKKMGKHNIGSLIVFEEGKPIGIFTERDYALRVGLLDKDWHDLAIREVMSAKLITITPRHTVTQCMNIMTENHIRYLPVLEDGKLAGIISIGDIVKDIIEELEFTINQMEKYILGLR